MNDVPRRDSIAVQPPLPGLSLTGFPAKVVAKNTVWHREHGTLGPWYFASGPGGRFNLDTPRGTLYLANTEIAAVKERIGSELARTLTIPADLIADRSVTTLVMPMSVRLAYLTSGKADQWGVVANELATVSPYDVPRAWARLFDAAGFGGIWTCLRYGNTAGRGMAIFGREGPRGWRAEETITVREVLRQNHYAIAEPPTLSQITIVDPDDEPPT